MLETGQSISNTGAESSQIESEVRGARALKTAQRFAKKDGGPTTVAALQMQLRHSNLHRRSQGRDLIRIGVQYYGDDDAST